jgi:PhnB protein
VRRDRILHARLVVGDRVIMGSDVPPEHYVKPEGLFVSVTAKTPADADRVFHALADRGTVTMPIAKTFWPTRFGMLVDRFGTPWMVSCEQSPD